MFTSKAVDVDEVVLMSRRLTFFESVGDVSIFGVRALARAFIPPFELAILLQEVEEIGVRSLPLIGAAGVALGIVLTLHTRSTLISFGAEAWGPTLQAVSFFNELGPLVTALLVSGRVGAGIGAELANMRANEQIDAIEVLSVDASKMLVSTRIVACIISLPLLTIFMDFASLLGGFISEYCATRISLQLYVNRAFVNLSWASFIAPTLKTCVFGFIIGTVSCYFGFTIDEGSAGVRRAATNSVVLSSLLVILSDVCLVKIIYFFFPGSAL